MSLDIAAQEAVIRGRIAYYESLRHRPLTLGQQTPGYVARKLRILPRLYQALAKIESGTYELCSECEEPIGEARLQAIPGAILCIHCQTDTTG